MWPENLKNALCSLHIIHKEHFIFKDELSNVCNSILRQMMVEQAQPTVTLPVPIKPLLGPVEYHIKQESFF